MAAETGFLIDGRHYPVPSIDTFTLDEAQVLYEYSGLAIEDFLTEDDSQRNGKNPGLVRALMHVAYQRGNPRLAYGKVRELVGSFNAAEAIASVYASLLADMEAADDVPLESTSEPNRPSSSSSLENERSTSNTGEKRGSGSPTGSDEPDETPAPTGVLRSVTSAISPQEISAA